MDKLLLNCTKNLLPIRYLTEPCEGDSGVVEMTCPVENSVENKIVCCYGMKDMICFLIIIMTFNFHLTNKIISA